MDDDLVVGGNAVTPMKRVPILANFEEWMKMATDNKINATNSWNFALIDYFHDMTLLKEGDGVNFQKASCTLDGCVKIYTSRVDSVATETGKLLSGLADNNGSKKKKGEEGDESEEEVEDEDGVVVKKPKKKTQRSSEATLASSFTSLQLKKFELEFSVDPLFKKASADFDEGGAKGLLLNHLAIDSDGRIVFDSSDDAGDATAEGKDPRRRSDGELEEGEADPDSSVDTTVVEDEDDSEGIEMGIAALGARFFPNLAILDEQDICPSLRNFDLGDPSGSMDIPFLKAPEDWRAEREKDAHKTELGDQTGIFLDDDNPIGFDDDDGLLADLAAGHEAGFGEGGEAWAREAAIEPQMRVYDAGNDDGMGMGDGEDGEGMGPGPFDPVSGTYMVSMKQKGEPGHEDILSYFDQALNKNWAGPEHWRIRKIKDATKTATTTKVRKEKEPFEIDFLSPLDPGLVETIYTPASSNSVISMPKKEWKSKTRNLLPDDRHFNSKQLLRLFLKPKASMGTRRLGLGTKGGFGHAPLKTEEVPEGELDEAFWAQKEAPVLPGADEDLPKGDYDANFFQDDGLPMAAGMDDDDDMVFADARDHFSPGLEDRGGEGGMAGINNILNGGSQDPNGETAFGTQLVTQSRRLRPEYVQYARVAKKVDVRRLKEEMWKGIGFEGPIVSVPLLGKHPKSNSFFQEAAVQRSDRLPTPPEPAMKTDPDATLKFTSVMNDLQTVYPKQVMSDISTSYCFICLLHLANEKGLIIEKDPGLTELTIKKDHTAEITVGGE
jgi:condensin complex subunit 2